MTRVVVGMFDERSDAEAVRQELVEIGVEPQAVRVYDQPAGAQPRQEEGFWERLKEFFGGEDAATFEEGSRRGCTVVAAEVEEGAVESTATIMDEHHAVDVDRRRHEWYGGIPTPRTHVAEGAEGTAEPGMIPEERLAGSEEYSERHEAAEGEETRIPVVEEQVHIGKQRIQRKGAARVYSRVIEEPFEEEVPVRTERTYVERRPADRPAEEGAFQEREIEVTETREEPVVSKEAAVVEEVVVHKEVEEHPETVRGTKRRTEVEVEQEKDRPERASE